MEILLRAEPGTEVSIQKFWCAYPMAKHLRDEFIDSQRPSCLSQDESLPLRGKARKHMRNLIASRVKSFRATMTCHQLLQGTKRACAPIGESFMAETCNKHMKAMTQTIAFHHFSDFEGKLDQLWRQSVSSPWVTIPKVKFHPSLRKRKAEDAVDDDLPFPRPRCYRVVSKPREFVPKVENPKPHASMEAGREVGGRSEFITLKADFTDEQMVSDSLGFYRRLPLQRDLLSMVEVLPGKVISRYGYSVDTYAHSLWQWGREVVPAPTNMNLKFFRGHDAPIFHSKELDMSRPLRAKAVCLSEPLKCRVITKGEAVPYHLSQSMQKKAWGILQEIPAFALTGQLVDGSHIYDLKKKTNDLHLPFDKWVSGDYKAATDNLSLDVNQLALGKLLDALQVSEKERLLAKKVLGAHSIEYGVTMYHENEFLCQFMSEINQSGRYTMTNGQLMGSPLSFPVLCAINLVAYWCALEEYTGRKFRKHQLPVLINGDDILFRANDAFYQVWQKWIKRAGFELSLGKNYISPEYLTVNSQGWIDYGSYIRRMPLLNCGLLLEKAAGPWSTPVRADAHEMPLIPKLNELLANCNNPGRTFDKIKHYHRDGMQSILVMAVTH